MLRRTELRIMAVAGIARSASAELPQQRAVAGPVAKEAAPPVTSEMDT